MSIGESNAAAVISAVAADASNVASPASTSSAAPTHRRAKTSVVVPSRFMNALKPAPSTSSTARPPVGTMTRALPLHTTATSTPHVTEHNTQLAATTSSIGKIAVKVPSHVVKQNVNDENVVTHNRRHSHSQIALSNTNKIAAPQPKSPKKPPMKAPRIESALLSSSSVASSLPSYSLSSAIVPTNTTSSNTPISTASALQPPSASPVTVSSSSSPSAPSSESRSLASFTAMSASDREAEYYFYYYLHVQSAFALYCLQTAQSEQSEFATEQLNAMAETILRLQAEVEQQELTHIQHQDDERTAMIQEKRNNIDQTLFPVLDEYIRRSEELNDLIQTCLKRIPIQDNDNNNNNNNINNIDVKRLLFEMNDCMAILQRITEKVHPQQDSSIDDGEESGRHHWSTSLHRLRVLMENTFTRVQTEVDRLTDVHVDNIKLMALERNERTALIDRIVHRQLNELSRTDIAAAELDNELERNLVEEPMDTKNSTNDIDADPLMENLVKFTLAFTNVVDKKETELSLPS